MSSSHTESFKALAERLYSSIHAVHAIAPTGSPNWSDEDAERLASVAADENPELQAVAEAARHGLLNVGRILRLRVGNPYPLERSTIDAYRQYHTFAAVHLFALVQRLRNAPTVESEDPQLNRFIRGLFTLLRGE